MPSVQILTNAKILLSIQETSQSDSPCLHVIAVAECVVLPQGNSVQQNPWQRGRKTWHRVSPGGDKLSGKTVLEVRMHISCCLWSLTISFRGSVSLATPLTPVFSSHLSNHTKPLGTNITNLSDRRAQPARVHLSANLHFTCRKPCTCKAGLKVCISCFCLFLLMLCNLPKFQDVFDGDLFLSSDSCRDELLCNYHLLKKKKSKAELEVSRWLQTTWYACFCGVD